LNNEAFQENHNSIKGISTKVINAKISFNYKEVDTSISLKELSDTIDWKYAKIFERELDMIKGIIVMFDITNFKSYTTSKDWISFVQEKRQDKNYSIILCGNKSDLDSKRVVAVDEVLSYTNSIKAAYFETSLMTGSNVIELKKYILSKFNLEHNYKQEEKSNATSCYVF